MSLRDTAGAAVASPRHRFTRGRRRAGWGVQAATGLRSQVAGSHPPRSPNEDLDDLLAAVRGAGLPFLGYGVTVRTRDWTTIDVELTALIDSRKVPVERGVPEMVAVPLPLFRHVTPAGRLPRFHETLGTG